MKKILTGFGSVRAALWLFSALILACFIGAVAPEDMQPAIFYSWWFVLLLAAFSVNLLVCLVQRLARSFRNPGSLITHASILLVLAGSLVSFLFSERGSLTLLPGHSFDSFEKGTVRRPLGFSVALEEFSIDWYYPREDFGIGVVVKDKKFSDFVKAARGSVYPAGSTGYSFSVGGFFPDFSMDENGNPVNRSDELKNPAVLLDVTTPSGHEKRLVFAFHPRMTFGDDPNISFVFRLTPREFRSRVRFSLPGKTDTVRDIRVNHPATIRGFSFYQASYDETREEPQLTVLEVVRDPGTAAVFTGFILLNAGVVILYLGKWRKPRVRRC